VAQELSPRQREVLDAVEAVFLRDGLRAVRIGRLAEEVHCSRATLYELAPSKEELFLLVVDRLIRRVRQGNLDAIERETDPVRRLRAGLAASATGFAPLGPTFMEAVRGYPPARLLFEHHLADARTALERLIEDAIAGGSFHRVDARVVAEGLMAVIDRFSDPEFVRASGVDSSDALSEFFDVLIDGLRAR
jgi:AcrR family transcriptional regulator